MRNKYSLLNEVGFSGIGDVISSTLGLKYNISSIAIIGVALGSSFSIIQKFIDTYIYTPAHGVFILFFITALDIVLGLMKSIKFKERISSSKISRAVVRFIVQILFVGIFSNMHEVFNHFIYSWMVDVVLIMFTLSTIWSSIVNARKLNLITEDQHRAFEAILNIKNFFSRLGKGEK